MSSFNYPKGHFDDIRRQEIEGNPEIMVAGLRLRITGRSGRTWESEQLSRYMRTHEQASALARHQFAPYLAKVRSV